MIHQVHGNILLQKGIIIHGCNTLGAMGAGLALDIRNTYPKAYEKYIEHFNEHGLQLGLVIPVKVKDDVLIVNAMTQATVNKGPNDQRVHVDYDAIKTVFEKTVKLAKKYNMPIHFPQIGAGLAKGDWNKIQRIIDDVIPEDMHAYLWLYAK